MSACTLLRQKAQRSLIICSACMLVHIWAVLRCTAVPFLVRAVCELGAAACCGVWAALLCPCRGRPTKIRTQLWLGAWELSVVLTSSSINAILSLVLPIDLPTHVASVLNGFFPRTAFPCLSYLKTSGLCRQLLLGKKKDPQIFGRPWGMCDSLCLQAEVWGSHECVHKEANCPL